MGLDQIIIGFCGIASVWLTQVAREDMRRYACLFGLAAQPAWLWATFSAGQWAMFGLGFVYITAWGTGVWNFWLKPALDGRRAAKAVLEGGAA